MTKTTKAILAGAALAGLLAGNTATVQASNLLSSEKSISAQDQGADKKADKPAKEKHACKGQNSCSNGLGCATHGKKPS